MRKYAIGQTQFDESKHRRASDGKFTSGGGAPSMRQAQLVERSPGRIFEEKWGKKGGAFNAAKGGIPGGEHSPRPSWEKLGAKNPNLPASYTGSTQRESPVDGYSKFDVVWQRPKGMSAAEHDKIRLALVDTIKSNREGAFEKATERGLVPADMPRRTVNRAYNLAAMRAMHEFGVNRFEYSMSDSLKEEMKPLEPAMRFFQRRIADRMRADERTKGRWAAYKEEFGVPYPDKRLDKRPGKGNQMRLRWEKSQGAHTQFIKAALPGELLKNDPLHPAAATTMPIADAIIAAHKAGGRRTGPRPDVAAPEVLAVLPDMRRILRQGAAMGLRQAAAPGRARHEASERVIRDPRAPLHQLLG